MGRKFFVESIISALKMPIVILIIIQILAMVILSLVGN